MSDEAGTPNREQRVTAFCKRLEDYIVATEKADRTYVRENIREHVRPRVYAAEKGPVRVLRPGSLGAFYEGSTNDDDNMAPVVSEIIEAMPDEFRMDAVRHRQEQVAAIEQEKADSGMYRL